MTSATAAHAATKKQYQTNDAVAFDDDMVRHSLDGNQEQASVLTLTARIAAVSEGRRLTVHESTPADAQHLGR